MGDEKEKAWAEFLDSLGTNEASAFLSKLDLISLKARQKVFRQGECDDRLLFVVFGSLKITYWNSLKKKNEVFAHLTKGDICGSDTFFSHSPHTNALTTIEDSLIRCLYKKGFNSLISEYPAIENKLIKYCEKNQKKLVFKDVQEPGRRAYQRHNTFLKGQIQKIDSNGVILSQILPVIVLDVSIGGLGCSAEKLGVVEAEDYYQSQAQVTITYNKNSLSCNIQKKVKIVSVYIAQIGSSKIHLQFHEPLSEKIILDLVQIDSIL